MWVATADLPQGAGHPFYERLNQVLNAAGFDAYAKMGVSRDDRLQISDVG